MDLASIIGLVLGAAMMALGIYWGDGISAFSQFIDVSSVIITVGGSLSGVIGNNTMEDFVTGIKAFTLTLKTETSSTTDTINNIINLSNVARKEGLLALEEAVNDIDDDFLKKGIMLVVDGTDPELVRGILETDLVCIEARHKKVIAVWEKWAELGPAWGMIGTLIGLVKMLGQLDDVSTVGPSMAVALLTTFYGSFIANYLCNPIAGKLKSKNATEITNKEVAVEGLLSIQAGENPRVIEEKLKSFLAPKVRMQMGTGNEGGGE